MKKVLFIDRDGTLTLEPNDFQLDSFDKLIFYPNVFQYLSKIAKELDYELVIVTNQDGLGTSSFPENTFWPVHNFILQSFENEGVVFDQVFIDKSFPKDKQPTRKPGTELLKSYIDNPAYDLENSYVIGDRLTDMELAKNLGCKGILIDTDTERGATEVTDAALDAVIVLKTQLWEEIYQRLLLKDRKVTLTRNTKETK